MARDSLYIGLMSGTSMDGIDAALVKFGDREFSLVAVHSHAYPASLSEVLRAAIRDPGKCTVDKIGRLDQWVGECFRDAALELLRTSAVSATEVQAIGSHGQTLRHQPDIDRPFTLQIGDPNIIATGTGIDTVADFRRRDVADGGQGAPLAPAFHNWLFSDRDEIRVVLNIGGIANITILDPDSGVLGFDTGPGNTLLDAWIRSHQGQDFDADGDWAAKGICNPALLEDFLADPYFSQRPPKSTGFEYFNPEWIKNSTSRHDKLPATDVQATLAQLTVRSIADAILKFAPGSSKVLVCGGGVKNKFLMHELAGLLADQSVQSTSDYCLDADWVEAVAFAWLARQYVYREAGNLPSVTGAARSAVLGCLYPGSTS